MSAWTVEEWQAEVALLAKIPVSAGDGEVAREQVVALAQLGALLAERLPVPERLTDAGLDGMTDEALAAALERTGGLPAAKGAAWDLAAHLRAAALDAESRPVLSSDGFAAGMRAAADLFEGSLDGAPEPPR